MRRERLQRHRPNRAKVRCSARCHTADPSRETLAAAALALALHDLGPAPVRPAVLVAAMLLIAALIVYGPLLRDTLFVWITP